jgi:hypothetical protein
MQRNSNNAATLCIPAFYLPLETETHDLNAAASTHDAHSSYNLRTSTSITKLTHGIGYVATGTQVELFWN